jgi:GNAT superfamily N-acetyltransferase
VLAEIDSSAACGDQARRADIRRWCEHGLVLIAEDGSKRPVGYSTLEYTFFEQGFVTMLMVAPSARRRGVGRRLLNAVEAACTTPKLFTSTNVSNHPMQQLLQRASWSPVGLLHGLDEGDPELFYLCPSSQLLHGLAEAPERPSKTP